MKKYKWTTHKIEQETEDTITIYFDTEQLPCSYLPGQYLNIKCIINSEQVIRSYSFSSVPSDEFPSITIKRVTNGKMSNYIIDNAVYIRTWEIEAPFGNFALENVIANQTQIVFLAGGSGISPLFAMLKSIDNTANIPFLLYSNKSPEEAIFMDEIEIMRTNGMVNACYSFTSSEIISSKLNHIAGRFSPLVLRSIIKKQIESVEEAHYYICGPMELMRLYQDTLLGMNIPQEQIHTEYFDPIPEEKTQIENDCTSKDVIVNYYIDNYIDDDVQTYECTSLIEVKVGQSLLDAMNEQNIKVSSSCNNGTCGACWAVKINGEVRMINNQALTAQDISEGIILLCQSYPINQDVCISVQ